MPQNNEDERLEQAAVEAFKELVESVRNNALEIYKSGVQYGKKDTVERACEWFYAQLNDGSMGCDDIQNFIDKFEKEMED